MDKFKGYYFVFVRGKVAFSMDTVEDYQAICHYIETVIDKDGNDGAFSGTPWESTKNDTSYDCWENLLWYVDFPGQTMVNFWDKELVDETFNIITDYK